MDEFGYLIYNNIGTIYAHGSNYMAAGQMSAADAKAKTVANLVNLAKTRQLNYMDQIGRQVTAGFYTTIFEGPTLNKYPGFGARGAQIRDPSDITFLEELGYKVTSKTTPAEQMHAFNRVGRVAGQDMSDEPYTYYEVSWS